MTRLFVGNLPPKTTEEELSQEFGAYGKVSSVDIKEKQNANNSSSKFAFVTIEMASTMVQQCIQEFREIAFHGHYLTVSVAKESFLEKLKREREEAASEEAEKKLPRKAEKQEESDEFVIRKNAFAGEMKKNDVPEHDEESFLVKKRGQGARMVNGKLKIIGDPMFVGNGGENSGAEPTERDPRAMISEQKRLESLSRKKNTYNQQKFAIKAALTSGQKAENGRKIVFGDSEETIKPMKLLDDDDEDEDVDFSVRQQFQGSSGQKLLNLQAKFQGDKRFALTDDFRDEAECEENAEKAVEEVDDERKRQLEILEGVVGHSLTSSKPKKTFQTMLRYDPTKKDHEKYIRKPEDEDLPQKKDLLRREEVPAQVSSEKFYKINTNGIEQSFNADSGGFSLLKMLGRDEDDREADQRESYANTTLPGKTSAGKRFKYDSSDDEKDPKKTKKVPIDSAKSKTGGKKNKRGIFRESFFIQTGDARLQEGLSFFQALAATEGDQFQEKRHQLKQIVRRKIKKNQLKVKQNVPRKKFNGKTKKRAK
ncbi:probable RNA-binding protein CG14230 [Phlebotomus argentipes]|uniref:probable RNA-binding protein CG14230 n=1 Tax=Phlebotomus argentipes TaxID=94469 RepID=UPI0028929CCA|nr:probable RNA-binding protein CG14230 [Phlebotomus argentipes]